MKRLCCYTIECFLQQFFSFFQQWRNFKNRLRFDKVSAKSLVAILVCKAIWILCADWYRQFVVTIIIFSTLGSKDPEG